MRKHERKKRSSYGELIDLEKAHDRVNKKALWRVLRMYDVDGKCFSGIKSM